MDISDALKEKNEVAPFTGAWIEIFLADFIGGIKGVAPFTGAWIEISRPLPLGQPPCPVAPFTGAWIEIWKQSGASWNNTGSHPSRVRGLKYWC